MSHRKRFLGLILVSMIIFFISCRSDRDELKIVSNAKPAYDSGKNPILNKLYEIDASQISMFSKETGRSFENAIDFDENNNMYILDRYRNTIVVFDEKGKFIKSFGRTGQGPNEFVDASSMVVHQGRIFVFQGLRLKIVDLNGDYISNHTIPIENPLKYKKIADDFYILAAKLDQSFTKLEFNLRVANNEFSKNEVIFRSEYSASFQGPNYNFNWPKWILITPSGEFFFPEDNLTKFVLIKYDRHGKAKIWFDRKYKIKPYSEEARGLFNSLYRRQIKEGTRVFPLSPPVVRTMFQDKKSNLWVISGETTEDNENPEYENTVDIFNEKGEWLYSFKSKILSLNCFSNNGKIYRIAPVDPVTFKQSIEVYEIEY